jgi:hypothetical protein
LLFVARLVELKPSKMAVVGAEEVYHGSAPHGNPLAPCVEMLGLPARPPRQQVVSLDRQVAHHHRCAGERSVKDRLSLIVSFVLYV